MLTDSRLLQTVFNKMMSGEKVSVAQKFQQPTSVAWNSHFSAAGNQFWASEKNNDMGQLSRRVVVFDFKEVCLHPSSLAAAPAPH